MKCVRAQYKCVLFPGETTKNNNNNNNRRDNAEKGGRTNHDIAFYETSD